MDDRPPTSSTSARDGGGRFVPREFTVSQEARHRTFVFGTYMLNRGVVLEGEVPDGVPEGQDTVGGEGPLGYKINIVTHPHDDDPLPLLGNIVLLDIEQAEIDLIPTLGEVLQDGLHDFSCTVGLVFFGFVAPHIEEALDVFQEEIGRPFEAEQAENLQVELVTGIGFGPVGVGHREPLAGETAHQEVTVRDGVDGFDISVGGLGVEVFFVGAAGILVVIVDEDMGIGSGGMMMEPVVEPTTAGEQGGHAFDGGWGWVGGGGRGGDGNRFHYGAVGWGGLGGVDYILPFESIFTVSWYTGSYTKI